MPRDPRYTDFDPAAIRQADRTRYRGEAVDVLYDRNRCMHAAECGRASKAIFNNQSSPWINPDAAGSPEQMLAIVARCPTGALKAEVAGEPAPETPPAHNTITVSPDGPLFVRGEVQIAGEGAETRAALCRCGASSIKPYCDNSHVRLRFKDSGAVNSDADGPDLSGGPITITPCEGGPLQVTGAVTLCAASGRAADTSGELWLCRCGNSKNKPYCDGSHNTEGFRSVGG